MLILDEYRGLFPTPNKAEYQKLTDLMGKVSEFVKFHWLYHK